MTEIPTSGCVGMVVFDDAKHCLQDRLQLERGEMSALCGDVTQPDTVSLIVRKLLRLASVHILSSCGALPRNGMSFWGPLAYSEGLYSCTVRRFGDTGQL